MHENLIQSFTLVVIFNNYYFLLRIVLRLYHEFPNLYTSSMMHNAKQCIIIR